MTDVTVVCGQCGYESPQQLHCPFCGKPLVAATGPLLTYEDLRPPWGKLALDLRGADEIVVTKVRELWQDFERIPPLSTGPSQHEKMELEKIVQLHCNVFHARVVVELLEDLDQGFRARFVEGTPKDVNAFFGCDAAVRPWK